MTVCSESQLPLARVFEQTEERSLYKLLKLFRNLKDEQIWFAVCWGFIVWCLVLGWVFFAIIILIFILS